MFWRWAHRFILWFPAAATATYLTVLGIAANAVRNDAAQAWFNDQISMWHGIMIAPYGMVSLILLVALWLALFLWTGQRSEAHEIAVERAKHPIPAATQERKQFRRPLPSRGNHRDRWVQDRDTHIKSALWYALTGDWNGDAEGILFDSMQRLDGVIERFREAARDGHLRVWGMNPDSGLYQLIEASFWRSNTLDRAAIFAFMSANESTRSLNAETQQAFSGIMVNRAEVEGVWPHAS
jgi:hypothetical protein